MKKKKTQRKKRAVVLDGHAREAQVVAPSVQRVLFVAGPLPRLAQAPRVHQQRRALTHEDVAVLARAVDAADEAGDFLHAGKREPACHGIAEH